MALWDTIKNLNPVAPVNEALTPPQTTVGAPIETQPLPQKNEGQVAQQEAVAAGKAARDEAIKRGRGE